MCPEVTSLTAQHEEKYATSATDLKVNAAAKSASEDVATPTDGISFGEGSQNGVQGMLPNQTDSVPSSAASVEKDYQELSDLPRRLNQDSSTALSNAGTLQYPAAADAAKMIRSLPAPQRELDPMASDNTTPPPPPSTLDHEPKPTGEVTLPIQAPPPRDHDTASIAQREDTESSPGGRRVLIIGPLLPPSNRDHERAPISRDEALPTLRTARERELNPILEDENPPPTSARASGHKMAPGVGAKAAPTVRGGVALTRTFPPARETDPIARDSPASPSPPDDGIVPIIVAPPWPPGLRDHERSSTVGSDADSVLPFSSGHKIDPRIESEAIPTPAPPRNRPTSSIVEGEPIPPLPPPALSGRRVLILGGNRGPSLLPPNRDRETMPITSPPPAARDCETNLAMGGGATPPMPPPAQPLYHHTDSDAGAKVTQSSLPSGDDHILATDRGEVTSTPLSTRDHKMDQIIVPPSPFTPEEEMDPSVIAPPLPPDNRNHETNSTIRSEADSTTPPTQALVRAPIVENELTRPPRPPAHGGRGVLIVGGNERLSLPPLNRDRQTVPISATPPATRDSETNPVSENGMTHYQALHRKTVSNVGSKAASSSPPSRDGHTAEGEATSTLPHRDRDTDSTISDEVPPPPSSPTLDHEIGRTVIAPLLPLDIHNHETNLTDRNQVDPALPTSGHEMQPSIGSEVIPSAPADDRERTSIVRDELVPSLPRATHDDEISSFAIAPNSVPAPAPGRRTPSIVTIPLPAPAPDPPIEGGSPPAGVFASRRLMQSGGSTSHRREHQLLKYYLSHM